MDNLLIMQNVVDYIEDNLSCELSANELASLAGFSTYHFYRIFNDYIGMAVIQYITKRRLLHAIYEISKGEKMIDAALAYGFDTHAGFYKAFKKEFGCSPTKYIHNIEVLEPQKMDLRKELKQMLSNTQIKELLSNWNLPKPLTVSNAYVSNFNIKSKNMWIINNNYILKSGSNISGLKQHLALSNALKNAGFTSAGAIQLKDGSDYFLDKDTYYCLFPCLTGKSITNEDLFKPNYLSFARYLGEIVGQLHTVLEELDENTDCNDVDLYVDICNWAIPEVRKSMKFWDSPLPDEFFDDYINNFKKLHSLLPYHIIHRNIHPGNILMENNKLVGFIDFELSERNVRLFDPCYCATGILSGCIDDPDKREKWILMFKEIISGYNAICPLTKEEFDSILYVVYSIQLICIAYFNSHDEYKKLAEANKKMLLFIYENREKLTAIEN